VLALLARRHWVWESVLPMQLRSRRPWLQAPRANPAAEPRVDLAHTDPADRADLPHRAPAGRVDPAHTDPAGRADLPHRAPAARVDLAHTDPAGRADQVNSDQVDRVGRVDTAPADRANSDQADPVDQVDTAPADRANSDQADPVDQVDTAPADRANSADQADLAATGRGTEIRNVAISREPPGGTDRGPGGRVSHQGRPTTDPFRRPAGDGTMVRSTTSAINRHRGGILDSTNGASTSSVFGSRCKDQLARCLLDQSAKRASRLLGCLHSPQPRVMLCYNIFRPNGSSPVRPRAAGKTPV
jgi:hypothetical protein